ncbi:MAG: hydrogenase maturation nickel metallochaperone HypA [Candidatus Aminicenantes bacterium]|nr:hydrogenase maturation nickel metallochaperone HypA [Candidatus Aminicenantes bacterium]
MHEAAIIEDVIRQVLHEGEKNRLVKISMVFLTVGRLHHLVLETMTELFDLMKKEFPILNQATLKVDMDPLRFVCRSCGQETEADAPSFSCPACRSVNIQILSGYELILARIEGEQNE